MGQYVELRERDVGYGSHSQAHENACHHPHHACSCPAAHKERKKNGEAGKKVSLKQIFPFFILYFIAASVITTVMIAAGIDAGIFTPVKELSKFFIVLAMAAIGLNTDIVKLIKTGGRPIIMGFCCWIGITGVSLAMQHFLGIW